MSETIKGDLIGKRKKFCLVVSEFNDFVTTRLLNSAINTLEKHEVKSDDITVIWVPGAFEIPPIVNRSIDKGNYSGIICLGAVIRGETPHFEYISNEVIKGIAKIALTSSIPVTNGVITTDSLEQAIQRAGAKGENRGKQAALTSLQMVNLYDSIT